MDKFSNDYTDRLYEIGYALEAIASNLEKLEKEKSLENTIAIARLYLEYGKVKADKALMEAGI